MKKRILTGDRPTGKLHIGHYLGSLQNRVKLQEEYEQYVMVADVQALTDNFNNPEKVRSSVIEVTTDNLAAGVDPEKTNILIQSMIPEIAELTVFYSNLVTVNRLQRNPTVKTEISQKRELFGAEGDGVTYGFLGYPVSQAADITVFNADTVPVGEDQLPMIEQTREIVRKFNSLYGEVLKEPEALIGEVPRVKGLDGNSKMGKSLGNAIYLGDTEEVIKEKVMGALTDTSKIKKDDKANPDICMVSYYHEIFSKNEIDTIKGECRNGLRGCVDCKRQLIKNLLSDLSVVREKRAYYEKRPELVKEILMEGTKKAKIEASMTLEKVKEAMKIDYFKL